LRGQEKQIVFTQGAKAAKKISANETLFAAFGLRVRSSVEARHLKC
jgi:hypothetical protein